MKLIKKIKDLFDLPNLIAKMMEENQKIEDSLKFKMHDLTENIPMEIRKINQNIEEINIKLRKIEDLIERKK